MTQPHDIDSNDEPASRADDAPTAQDVIERGRAASRVLESVIGPVVTTMGYELVHLEWAHTARPRVVRLYLDREGGMTLDDCAKMSPILGNALDAAEHDPDAAELRAVLDAAYVLEVSSPGIERPLSRRSQMDRNVGARATIRTWAPVVAGGSQKTFHGHIVATAANGSDDDREGSVSLQDDEGVVHEISLSLIRRAHLVYEPEQARKPTGHARGARAPSSGGSESQKAVNRE